MDDALDVAKGISCANPNCILFVLLPQLHPSTEKPVVVKNRRDIEDKLMSPPGAKNRSFCVSVCHDRIIILLGDLC